MGRAARAITIFKPSSLASIYGSLLPDVGHDLFHLFDSIKPPDNNDPAYVRGGEKCFICLYT